MRRVRYHSHGGPDVLVIEEAAVPVPGPGQVLIRTEAIGVNWVDVQLRRETRPDSIYFRPLPATLTGDVVGTVEAAGPGVDTGLAGARVAALTEDAYADYVLADAGWLVQVPGSLGAGAATMLPMTAPLALGLLNAGRLAKEETVLITAGAGVIGHLAVQLARLLGAGTVVATAGSAAKLGFVRDLGADVTINHRAAGWADQVRAAVPGGVDVALDAIGGHALLECLGTLAPFGRAVAYGGAAGGMGSVPVLSLARLKTVTGSSLLAWRAATPEQARAAIAEATELFGTGRLRAVADTVLPLAEARQAHRLLEERTVPGRILLVP